MQLALFAKRVSAAFLLLTLPAVCLAQSTPTGSAEFSCVTWEALPFTELFFRKGEEFVKLDLLPGNRSEVYSIPVNSPLQLFTLVEDEEGNKLPRLLGGASLPEGSRRVLFFINHQTGGGSYPLTVTGIDDALKAFPPGTYKFVNMTPIPLEAEIGSDRARIEPNAMTVVRPEVPELGGFIPFYVYGPQGQNIFETRMFAQRRERNMVFISPPPKGGDRLMIKVLPHLVARKGAED